MSIVDACGSESGRGDVGVVWRLVGRDVGEERRVVLEDVVHGGEVDGGLGGGEALAAGRVTQSPVGAHSEPLSLAEAEVRVGLPDRFNLRLAANSPGMSGTGRGEALRITGDAPGTSGNGKRQKLVAGDIR